MMPINSLPELLWHICTDEKNWKQYGEVSVQDIDDLLLFNYTPKAQYDNRWNWFEQVSRGLIISRGGLIVARPFDKFWNYGEDGRMPEPGATLVAVQEKMDGSLGISYRWRGESYIATRGSRFSPQAQWATRWWREHLAAHGIEQDADEWRTLLFEIIYPENRVVVDYGAFSGLVLLAARDRINGSYADRPALEALAEKYQVQIAPFYDVATLDDLQAAIGQMRGKEGLVAIMSDGSRWKFKTEEYRELHRLMWGLSFQGVLKAISEDRLADVFDAPLPDALRWQATAWSHEIESLMHSIMGTVASFMARLPGGLTRKEVAVIVQQQPAWLRPYLFAAYDNKPLRPMILKNEFRDRSDRAMTGGDA